MYFLLLCVLHVNFVFSGALPFDTKYEVEADGGGPNFINWVNAVNKQGICKLNGTLPADCNTCSCIEGRPPACTLMACPPKYEGTNKNCKPGDRWKEDCNKCICSDSGLAHCTIRDCASRKRMKRYFGFVPEHGKRTVCTPGSKWKVDCNTCFCTETGVPDCTFKACLKWERITDKNNLVQEIKDILNADGKCKSLTEMIKVSCNTCFCSEDGELYCTQKRCSKKDRRKRSSGSKIPAGGKCKPGDKWKLDECNNCVCTHTGFASCTLNDCSSSQQRPKRSPAESGKIPAGGKCKPGDRWKLDECNNCVCTHTGFASCTLNDCSSSQQRPKRSPAESGKIPPGGKCKPGDRWKLDECNSCICTHTEFASCTLNECSDKKNRGKRSSDGSQLSDFMDENGICKQNVSFKLDCNTCFCRKGATAGCTLKGCQEYKNETLKLPQEVSTSESSLSEFVDEEGKCKLRVTFKLDCNSCFCPDAGNIPRCTLMGCLEYKNKTQRLTRDIGKENGNSGRECKPGVTWRENCNSCFCSERGVAMCTDIPTCPSPPPPDTIKENVISSVISKVPLPSTTQETPASTDLSPTNEPIETHISSELATSTELVYTSTAGFITTTQVD